MTIIVGGRLLNSAGVTIIGWWLSNRDYFFKKMFTEMYTVANSEMSVLCCVHKHSLRGGEKKFKKINDSSFIKLLNLIYIYINIQNYITFILKISKSKYYFIAIIH